LYNTSTTRKKKLTKLPFILKESIAEQRIVLIQPGCVALSTVEAEYIATGRCCAQILWIKQ